MKGFSLKMKDFMKLTIKKVMLQSSILVGLSIHISLYAPWRDHATFTNILTAAGIIIPLTMKLYDEAQKDPHQEERAKVLTQQAIALNKQDLAKGDQRVEENNLYLEKQKLEIEKDRHQLKVDKLDLQANSCEKCADAMKRLAEIVSLTSPAKRAALQEKIDAEVELLIRSRCGFKEGIS
jgi:hypothetical protein